MPRRAAGFRNRLAVGALALLAVVSGGVITGTGSASAAQNVVQVYSAAMGRNIPVWISHARTNNAATLYLLDGLRAPNNNNGWLINTDVRSFFANKNVNVAMPFGGAGSFYSDWEQRDPVLGKVKWETFLTRELPAYMRGQGSDGRRNAIAGLSMSGTSALNLTAHHPGFYQAAASYSGYPIIAAPGFAQGIQVAVAQVGGNPANMWGPWPAGEWVRNDPSLNVGALRGKSVYLSAGAGLPGGGDDAINPASPRFNPTLFAQLVPLETAAGISTRLFVPIAQAAGVRLTTQLSPVGDHWWPYWQRGLHQSWSTTIAPALGTS
nr:alpha/beta hydrolase family protein [Williamsia sterculiae]